MEQEAPIEVKYTENAKKRLDELTLEYIKRLEYHLKRRKYRKGRNYIEVTTADLESVARHYKYVSKENGLNILKLYVIFSIGAMALISGGLWKLFRSLAENSKDYAPLIITIGLALMLLSVDIYFYIKLAESEKKKEKEKRMGRK